ncbi:MAG: PhzF family phenazine biosynthesis protein [Bacteroidetes bacterium]|nr:MAG: PhzF family phenazine biosynthesis protein [Bacteroidota bacterium]
MYPIFQVDAFTDTLFAGNPAAVVPLQNWLPDTRLQQIAAENNLSETAFFIPLDQPGQYHIRWFTPVAEVDLCGHATLATAHVLFHHLDVPIVPQLSFESRSGILTVSRQGDWLTLDFPTDRPTPATLPEEALAAFANPPLEIRKGREDYLLVYATEQEVLALAPDFRALHRIPARGFIATAPGEHSDFVSRCFFPAYGIDEDPVTGSAHTTLTPYWANRLQKNDLEAIQRSARQGRLRCTLQGDRVLISGQACLYMKGSFLLPETE